MASGREDLPYYLCPDAVFLFLGGTALFINVPGVVLLVINRGQTVDETTWVSLDNFEASDVQWHVHFQKSL